MGEERLSKLSRRERQMMEVIYRRGRASAAEVREGLPDPPSYSAVRTLLTILEGKGYVEHVKEGARYIYLPVQRRDRAGRAALRRVVQTFYDGSLGKAVTALVDLSGSRLSPDEIGRLSRLIQEARKEGR
jgi:predicted transcriptional regulator